LQQLGDFQKVALFRQLVDGIAAMQQDAFVADKQTAIGSRHTHVFVVLRGFVALPVEYAADEAGGTWRGLRRCRDRRVTDGRGVDVGVPAAHLGVDDRVRRKAGQRSARYRQGVDLRGEILSRFFQEQRRLGKK